MQRNHNLDGLRWISLESSALAWVVLVGLIIVSGQLKASDLGLDFAGVLIMVAAGANIVNLVSTLSYLYRGGHGVIELCLKYILQVVVLFLVCGQVFVSTT